jgi:hypothetical protein
MQKGVVLTPIMSQLSRYKKRINELFPELTIKSISLNQDGLLNDVVVVNGELVFRFVKRDFGFKDPSHEAKLLTFLQNYITLEIPGPFYVSQEVLGYRFIRGKTLRRDILLRLPDLTSKQLLINWRVFFMSYMAYLYLMVTMKFRSQTL